MSSWKGKTRGGVLGYKIFIFAIKYGGLKVAYSLLIFVALYYWAFTNKKPLKYFYHNRLRKSKVKSLLFIYKLYYRFGQILIDKIAILGNINKKFTFDFDGEHHIRDMKSGGILIGAHMGNWEIAGQLLQGRLPSKINIIMFDEEHQRIKNLLDNVLKDKSFEIIPLKQDMSHIYRINQIINNHELIVMNGDRYVKGSKTIEYDFLGKKAVFPAGPFHIALKFNVPVSFVFALKESNTHYHFYASEPKIYSFESSEDKKNMFDEILKDYIFELEKKVESYPDQWFNFYDFWGINK